MKQIPISDLDSFLSSNIDALICCGSFESRCRSVADALSPNRFKWIIVGQNQTVFDPVSTNTDYLINRFKGGKVTKLNLSEHDPIATEDAIRAKLCEAFSAGIKSFAIDITTFTREGLLILFNQFRQFRDKWQTVTMIYTGAEEYSLGDKPEKMWLSKGIRQIRSVLGFPGRVMPNRKTHLIVLVGFEVDRAARLIEQYEPSILSIGYGPKSSSITPAHHAVNVFFYKKLLALYANVHQFSFPPNDPIATKDAILAQILKFPQTNVILSGLNTKLSTIGTAIAAFENADIQLAYAEADLYNYTNYSSPGSKCYIFDPIF